MDDEGKERLTADQVAQKLEISHKELIGYAIRTYVDLYHHYEEGFIPAVARKENDESALVKYLVVPPFISSDEKDNEAMMKFFGHQKKED